MLFSPTDRTCSSLFLYLSVPEGQRFNLPSTMLKTMGNGGWHLESAILWGIRNLG